MPDRSWEEWSDESAVTQENGQHCRLPGSTVLAVRASGAEKMISRPPLVAKFKVGALAAQGGSRKFFEEGDRSFVFSLRFREIKLALRPGKRFAI